MNKNNIIEFYNEQQYKNNTLLIMCYIIDICNFRCEYCCNNFPRKNTCLDTAKLLNYIDSYYATFKRMIHIVLMGGEPTLHFKLVELCKELSNRKFISFTVISNLSADISVYKQLLNLNGNLIFSWHSENTHFIQKLDSLIKINSQYKSKIFIPLMYETAVYNTVQLIANQLEDMQIDFSLTYIRKPLHHKTKYNFEYTAKQIDYYNSVNLLQLKNVQFKNKLKKFICNTENESNTAFLHEFFPFSDIATDFKMYKCNAGLDEIYIHSDGKIYACEDSYRAAQKNIGIIDVFDKSMFKSRICKINNCNSPYFSKKTKILFNAQFNK